MILRNRVIWSDNGVLKDISDAVNNHISGTKVIPIVAAQDYIYLGSDAPFNHRWFELGVVNALASKIEVALWDGSQWVDAVEVIDLTLDSTGLKTLAQSGRMVWVPNRQKTSWSRDDTKDHANNVITGLGTVTIYDLFWARLKFTGDLTAGTELKYLGWKFAGDEDLYSLYPEFDTTEARERFKPGLTTWDQVHFEAAKQVLRDLKSTQVITSENQVIEWEVLKLPSVYKTAELIFSNFGEDFQEERKLSIDRYKKAMQADLFNVDQDGNAELNVRDLTFRTGRLVR